MRKFRLLAAVAAIWLSSTAYAQTSGEDLRIGYVSPAKVSAEAPQAEAARAKLEKEFAPRDKEIVAMQEDLRALEDRLQRDAAVMSDEEQQRLQRKVVSLRRDIQRTQEAFREDFNMRRNEELGELQRRILKTVGEFAKENDYDLILSEGVIHASEAVNVTDLIIERLRREHEREQ